VLSILEVKEDVDTPDDIVLVVSKFILPLEPRPAAAVTLLKELLLYLTNAI